MVRRNGLRSFEGTRRAHLDRAASSTNNSTYALSTAQVEAKIAGVLPFCGALATEVFMIPLPVANASLIGAGVLHIRTNGVEHFPSGRALNREHYLLGGRAGRKRIAQLTTVDAIGTGHLLVRGLCRRAGDCEARERNGCIDQEAFHEFTLLR